MITERTVRELAPRIDRLYAAAAAVLAAIDRRGDNALDVAEAVPELRRALLAMDQYAARAHEEHRSGPPAWYQQHPVLPIGEGLTAGNGAAER